MPAAERPIPARLGRTRAYRERHRRARARRHRRCRPAQSAGRRFPRWQSRGQGSSTRKDSGQREGEQALVAIGNELAHRELGGNPEHGTEGGDELHEYDHTLGLCRGPAFAEVADRPFAQGEAVRLEELRLVAAERGIDGLSRWAGMGQPSPICGR